MQHVLKSLKAQESSIGVVGLGYVGLPLASILADKYKVIGFDINAKRVQELRDGIDRTREVEDKKKLLNPNLTYTTDAKMLKQCSVVIVAVPTPVDEFKKPDLTPVLSASRTVGANMVPGTIVVFESTVYPGVTEGVCKNALEAASGMKYGKDFYLGYSPERVNPGDKDHTIDKIVKVVSGCTPEVLDVLAEIYGSVITAGVHRAPNIATAEAAKVIENTQRDINIALMNELSQIFEKIGLDTLDVLAASATKWNFMGFKPGLVGGHCIGVDPYYLTHLAESIGIHPQVILAGRRINDNTGRFVAQKTLKMLADGQYSFPPTIGILGVTFKENVPDLRNTKVIDVVQELEQYGAKVHMFDPIADGEEFHEEYGRSLTAWDKIPQCDALILGVAHQVFKDEFPMKRLLEKLNPKTKLIVDIKGMLSRAEAEKAGVKVWRL